MRDYIYCDYVKKHGVFMLVWYLDDHLPPINHSRGSVGAVEILYGKSRTSPSPSNPVVVRCRVNCYVDDYKTVIESIDNVMRRKQFSVKMWRRF